MVQKLHSLVSTDSVRLRKSEGYTLLHMQAEAAHPFKLSDCELIGLTFHCNRRTDAFATGME